MSSFPFLLAPAFFFFFSVSVFCPVLHLLPALGNYQFGTDAFNHSISLSSISTPVFIQCSLDYSVCLFGSKLGYLCQVCWFLVCLLLLTEMLNPVCLVTRLHLLFSARAYSASAVLPTTLALSVRLCLSTVFFSARPDLVQNLL